MAWPKKVGLKFGKEYTAYENKHNFISSCGNCIRFLRQRLQTQEGE